MHDEILRYSLSGQIDDNNLVQTKERLIHYLEMEMRDNRCVPALDMEPQFTLNYNPSREQYDFELTVYGVFVGGEVCSAAGTMNGKIITRYTPKTK